MPVPDSLAEAIEADQSLNLTGLFRDAVTGMAILDLDGRYRLVNPALCQLTGYAEEDLLGRHPWEITHPDDRERSIETVDRLIAGSDITDRANKRYLRPDGSVVSVLRTTTVLRDREGVPIGMFSQVIDVSEEIESHRQLEARESRFRALVSNLWDIITLHSADGRYLYVSPAATTQLGYEPAELIGTFPTDRMHPDDQAALEDFVAVATGLRESSTVEYRYRHCDGSWRWLQSTAHNWLGDPAIGAVVVATRDVTASRRRAAQQEAIAALSNEALRGGPTEGLLDHLTRTVAEVLEVPYCYLVRIEVDGRRTVSSPSDPAMADILFADQRMCPVAEDAMDKQRSVLWTGHPSSGPWADELMRIGLRSAAAAPVSPANPPLGVLAVYSPSALAFSRDDVTFLEAAANVLAAALNRRNAENELRRQAVHDDLTGLPNRVLLVDRLETVLARLDRRPGSVAVLFADLDNFKLVNDSLGHPAGDTVVATVANRLRAAVRMFDTVARFGGDEFVIVSEDTDDADARQLAERVRHTISSPIDLGSQQVSITASIGIVVTNDPAASADSLIADADMAMYAAKHGGKDRIAVFAPLMRERSTEQLETISGIRRGLANDEFRVFYQPIVRTTNGEVVGYEALARWEHPTLGLLGPTHFIDYAEACGLIVPLGERVLRTALEQAAEWRRAGAVSQVSVNVSGVQLLASDLVPLVRSGLADTGVDPRDLVIEVTESAVMADLSRAAAVLQSLRDIGVHVGIDDFGTGHSSLSQLTRLPFDFVKIDRSFLRDLETDDRAAVMLSSIEALCRALGLPAIVEGVETEDQLNHVRRLGIPLIQGYLFGRPVPAAELS